MEIRIKETGEIEELTIIDPKTGIDWSEDLVGDDDNITFDGDHIMCDQETYDWWTDLIERYQAADNRLHEIRTGMDNDARERLGEFLEQIAGCDLENYPEVLEDMLDRWECILVDRFAVVQVGYAVFGTGDSKDSAISDAHEWADFKDSDIVEWYDANDGDMVVVQASRRLCDKVKAVGGNVMFDIVDGVADLDD